MDINWQQPFQLAGELFLLVLGWTLVALVAFIALAITIGIGRGIITVFKKKSSGSDSDEAVENYLKSV